MQIFSSTIFQSFEKNLWSQELFKILKEWTGGKSAIDWCNLISNSSRMLDIDISKLTWNYFKLSIIIFYIVKNKLFERLAGLFFRILHVKF